MKRFVPLHQHDHQRGAVLVIALIMLLLTTLIVVASFQMGTSNLVVVSNLESRQQTQKAAEATLEIAVHWIKALDENLCSDDFAVPGLICAGRKSHRCFDLDGDGSDDIDVDLTTRYIGLTPIHNNDLNAENPNDRGCFLGGQQIGAVEGSNSKGYSMCSWKNLDLVARAVDLSTESETRVRQGVGIRTSSSDIQADCQ